MKGLVVGVSIFAATSLVFAAEEASIDKGKELFTSSQLGTNGKSCEMCHAGGSGLSKAARYGDESLGEIINQCIIGPLKGKALEPGSVEMKSLVRYIKSTAP
jgi:hypothetical protein